MMTMSHSCHEDFEQQWKYLEAPKNRGLASAGMVLEGEICCTQLVRTGRRFSPSCSLMYKMFLPTSPLNAVFYACMLHMLRSPIRWRIFVICRGFLAIARETGFEAFTKGQVVGVRCPDRSRCYKHRASKPDRVRGYPLVGGFFGALKILTASLV